MTGDVLEPADAAVIEAVIGLARALGLRPVAEGVETDAQWAELKRLGCEFAQGYFFSRPVPASEVGTLLAGELCLQPRIIAVDRAQRIAKLREEPGKPVVERDIALEPPGQPLVLRPHVGPHDVEVLHAWRNLRHARLRTPESPASRAAGPVRKWARRGLLPSVPLRARHRSERANRSSPARNALSCHPPEDRLRHRVRTY